MIEPQEQQKMLPEPKKNFWEQFHEFLAQYSVVGLAIGIIIGTAINALVQSLAGGILTPFIGLFLPKEGLQSLVFHVRNVDFRVGDVISALLQFVLVAFIVFFVVKVLLKNEGLLKKK